MRFRCFVVIAVVVGGCEGGGTTTDAAVPDGARPDHGSAICTADVDCDDMVFCNGREMCHVGAAGADARGCTVTPRCLASQTCNEMSAMCVNDCTLAPDADGDGHAALSCGGDDCDDADAQRYPGNPEVCDAAGHDEDCSPTTLAGLDGDFDGDGFVAMACCYLTPRGVLQCGNDCDDMQFGVHVGAIEVCNGHDDDCNGLLDGPAEDADRDGHANDQCAGAESSDCDDADPNVYVGATELCDGRDEDCMVAGVRRHAGEPGAEPTEDLDGDMHSPLGATCSVTAPAGVVVYPQDDCDDGRASVHGGARESCNAADDDCDSIVDDRAGGAAGSVCIPPHVGVGAEQTCVIEDDGSLDCFGANGCGELGDVSAPEGLVVHVALPSPAVEVDGGGQYTCARSMDGSVTCFGIDGLLFERDPLHNDPHCGGFGVVALGGAATDFSAGLNHACAVVGGAVKCWGNSGFNVLDPAMSGDPSTWSLPVTLPGITDATQVDAGGYMNCVVHGGGAVRCWGANFAGELGVPSSMHVHDIPITDATQVAVGSYYACAIRTDRTVVCWGANDSGALGCRGTAGCPAVGMGAAMIATTPIAVTGLTDVVDLESGGGAHVCARTGSGAVWCWGSNDEDQLGDDSYTSGSGPVATDSDAPVTAMHVSAASELAVSSSHTCVLTADRMRCFGRGGNRQLGDGQRAHVDPWDRAPQRMSVLSYVVDTAVSGAATCFVTPHGEMRCVGQSPFDELGSAGLGFPTFPMSAFGDTDDVAVDARGSQTLRAQASGELTVSGRYNTGTNHVPGVVAVASGNRHYCARTGAGVLYCWGYDTDGEVGDGTTSTSVPTATMISLGGSVLEVVAGDSFTCARTATDTYCWGQGAAGQLGSLPVGASATPRVVTSLPSRAVDLAAGDDSACAALASGAVMCWGGALGPFAASTTPTVVTGVSGAVQVAVGGSSACARTADGHLFCWGNGAGGRLGNGAALSSATPVPVTYVSDATDVVCGGGVCCAARACGQSVCWGVHGAWLPTAGDAMTTDALTPIGVAGMYTF